MAQQNYVPLAGFPAGSQPGYPQVQTNAPGYPASQLNPPAYSASQLNSPGYSQPQLSSPGYPPPQLNSPGYPGYPSPQVTAPGYPPPEMNAPGYPPPTQMGAPSYPPYNAGGPPPQGHPITTQPVQTQPPSGAPGNWMAFPPTPVNCPPGLEYLTQIDQLLVQQKVELLEAFIGFETANKYEVKNSLGQKVYYAVEDTDCLTRQCCGPVRPFDMKILDNSGNEIIHLYRPLRCDSCLFPCCLQRLEVMAPPGTIIGYVTQEWSIFEPKYSIENAAGERVLQIKGPFCTWSICGDVEFKVLSKDGVTEVGKIMKQWSGLIREAFTDSDNFGITFPMDLDVHVKAVLLGACFLIDFMFFEKSQNKEQDSPGMF